MKPRKPSLFARPAKAAVKRPEQSLQIGLFNFLRPIMRLQKYEQFIAFQIRNETGVAGKQGARLWEIAESMGAMSGVSDTVFLFPSQIVVGPPKTCFVEIKPYVPPKTIPKRYSAPDALAAWHKERKESLLSPAQVLFRDRVTAMGFEYHLFAATDVNDIINQAQALLRANGVRV